MGSRASASGSVAGVGLRLHGRVVQLRAAADPRPPELHAHRLAVGVQVDGPERGGPELAGQQAGRALAEHRRVQRRPAVGAVERLPAAAGLGVQRPAEVDHRADVGDRVADPVAVPADGEVHRLVEVAAADGVQGDQRDVGRVELGQPRLVAPGARPRPGRRRGNSSGTSNSARIAAKSGPSAAAAGHRGTRTGARTMPPAWQSRDVPAVPRGTAQLSGSGRPPCPRPGRRRRSAAGGRGGPRARR